MSSIVESEFAESRELQCHGGLSSRELLLLLQAAACHPLLAQHPIPFSQVLSRVLLVLIHPARSGRR